MMLRVFVSPPSGRERCYSSLASKHAFPQPHSEHKGYEGFRVPPIPATPGRTQPTPSASRSVDAELAGVAISIFGIRFTSFASVNVETLAAPRWAADLIGTPNPANGNKQGRRKRCQALSPSRQQVAGPQPRSVRGQQQGLNTPPSGREWCYSSLPAINASRQRPLSG